MRTKLLIVVAILLVFSCKKDRIEDEYSNLVGTWKWIQTNHTYGWCDNWEQSETLTPENQAANFTMEIFEKGIIKFYQNNEFLEKDRVVFSKYSGGECSDFIDCISFGINLNNDEEYNGNFNGYLGTDSLLLFGTFPFNVNEKNLGCESYVNYFVRE